MSTFQAAFLNEVIYVTNARFKESKEGCSLAAQGDQREGRALVEKLTKKVGKLTHLKGTTLLV